MGRLFPRETALLELLKLINDPELADLWAEDETIGWIYQYFNSQEERRQMRSESSAPATVGNWRCGTSSLPHAMWWNF